MNEPNDTKKKKLPVLGKTMLPEVLPAPARAAAPPSVSSPRARTMAHLQRLVATAAALGITTGASALEIACGKSTKVPGDTEGDGKGGPPVPPNKGNTSGYAVVDPMPPPAHCAGVAMLVRATAKFVKGDAGGLLLEVRFPNPVGRSDYKFLGTVATSYGGKVVKVEGTPDGVTVRLEPEPNVTSTTVTVKGNCNQGPSNVMANVSWTGPITEKTAATINLGDMYDF